MNVSGDTLKRMDYAHIVALIDADLDRLSQVRQLLISSGLLSPETKHRGSARPSQVESNARNERGRVAPVPGSRPRRQSRIGPAAETTRPIPQEQILVNVAAAPVDVKTFDRLPSYSGSIPDGQLVYEEVREHRTELEQEASYQKAIGPGVETGHKRVRRARLSKPGPAASSSALRGRLPVGPVFIPAQQIRLEQSQKQQSLALEHNSFGPQATVPLTAELLTQRWMQGSAS